MKLCLVTGANSEIGTSICNFLLKKNYKIVACIHQNMNNISKITDDNLIIKKIDLCNELKIKNLLEEFEFDLIINAAAYYFDDELENLKKEDIMKTLEVNLVAPLIISKYVKKGLVINISSLDGIDTYNELNIPYSVSKAGLNLLTKNLAYAVKNVKYYALALGWVDTKMINEINQTYLKSEMQRCNQNHLVSLGEINNYIGRILNGEFENGKIIKVDGKNE